MCALQKYVKNLHLPPCIVEKHLLGSSWEQTSFQSGNGKSGDMQEEQTVRGPSTGGDTCLLFLILVFLGLLGPRLLGLGLQQLGSRLLLLEGVHLLLQLLLLVFHFLLLFLVCPLQEVKLLVQLERTGQAR